MNRPTFLRGVKPLHPFYAAVGAADLALAKLRAMGGKAVDEAAHLTEPQVAADEVAKAVDGARHVPVRAFNQTLDVLVRSQNRFDELAERGKRVISRTRSEAHLPTPPELLQQAEETVALGRKVAARAAEDTRKAATSTLKQVRDETDHLVDDTRKAATATLKTVRAEADHVREVVTRRQLPKRPHVPTTLRRRTESAAAPAATPAADGNGQPTAKARVSKAAKTAKAAVAKTAAKTAAKTTSKPASKAAAPRPARKAPARKRTAAPTKTAEGAATPVAASLPAPAPAPAPAEPVAATASSEG